MTEFRTFEELQQMGIKNHNPLTRELETNDGRRWFRLYNNSPQWMEIMISSIWMEITKKENKD